MRATLPVELAKDLVDRLLSWNESLEKARQTACLSQKGGIYRSVREPVLRNAHLIFTSAHRTSSLYIDNTGLRYQGLIIDDASSLTEIGTLVPFVNASSPPQVILVGDPSQAPLQLRPTSVALPSYFSRLTNHIYTNVIKDKGESTLEYGHRFSPPLHDFLSRVGFQISPLCRGPKAVGELAKLRPAALIEVAGNETMSSEKKSRANMPEVFAVSKLVKYIKEVLVFPQTVAVLSPYSEQVKAIRSHFESIGLNHMHNLTIETVDSFRSSEADVVIVSTVRGRTSTKQSWGEDESPDIGFLSDPRR